MNASSALRRGVDRFLQHGGNLGLVIRHHIGKITAGRHSTSPAVPERETFAASLQFVRIVFCVLGSLDAFAQPTSPADIPSTPIAPEVMTRGPNGQATIRAIKLTTPLHVDGKLDEEVYQREQPFGGFIQVVPRYGAPQSERTDVWVMYDDHNMYVACRCWDSAPPDKWIANELRRDTNQLRQNDQIGVMFDTFYDRRSGFLFYTNPLGARADYSVVDEGGRTPTGIRCGNRRPAGSTAAGPSKWRSRSSRCATARAAIRCGASSCAAPSGARTNGRTSRRCRRSSPARRPSTAFPPAARWSASICRRPARTSS